MTFLRTLRITAAAAAMLCVSAVLCGLVAPGALAQQPLFRGPNRNLCPGPGALCQPVASYVGPSDAVSGVTWEFWVGLRAFSAATAGTKAANICNSGDANCADINTLANGKFDVATAQGAPLNCGGSGGTCTVKTLYDKSGNGRDVSQATAASRPTLTFSCIGSLPCMTVASGQGGMQTAGFFTISQPLTMIAAANQTSNAGAFENVLTGDVGTNNSVDFSSTDNNAACFAFPTKQNVAATDGSWFALQCLANGTSSSFTVNGSTTTFSGGTTGTGGQKFVVAGTGTPPHFIGKMVEDSISSTGFSSGQLSAMNSNIRNYWGF